MSFWIAGELELLALGQVLGVLPEREPGALELAWRAASGLAAGLVPDLAADLVQRVGGGLDDVKRVQADVAFGQRSADRPGDPVGVVAGHQLDLLAALFAQQIQELLDRLAVPAGVRPHQPAGVVVDHDGEVSLALADRDLIDPDPLESGEQVAAGLAPRPRLARRSSRPSATRSASAPRPRSCDVCTVSHAT